MARLAVVLVLAMAVLFAISRRTTEPVTTKVATSAPTYQTTTILGTWIWDIESNRLGREGDFWWQHATSTESYLTPMKGAKADLVRDRAFEQIDASYVRGLALSSDRIAGQALKPGAAVVFTTRNGRTGKLQIVGYKASHDFSFAEASELTEGWRKFSLGRPNSPDYHLQVKWLLLE